VLDGVKVALDLGADLNGVNSNGETVMHAASAIRDVMGTAVTGDSKPN
jgi:hypothetical protein